MGKEPLTRRERPKAEEFLEAMISGAVIPNSWMPYVKRTIPKQKLMIYMATAIFGNLLIEWASALVPPTPIKKGVGQAVPEGKSPLLFQLHL